MHVSGVDVDIGHEMGKEMVKDKWTMRVRKGLWGIKGTGGKRDEGKEESNGINKNIFLLSIKMKPNSVYDNNFKK